MIVHRLVRIDCLLTVALATIVATALPASAETTHPKGTDSLAALLAADGAVFDRDWNDYDIVDAAVTAVLTAKPRI